MATGYLRDLRLQAGLATTDVSTYTDISVKFLNAYERGEKRVTDTVAAKLCRVYHVPFAEFREKVDQEGLYAQYRARQTEATRALAQEVKQKSVSSLTQFRGSLGIGIEDVCNQTGWTRNYMRAVESNKTGMSRERLELLAKIYGVEPIEIESRIKPSQTRDDRSHRRYNVVRSSSSRDKLQGNEHDDDGHFEEHACTREDFLRLESYEEWREKWMMDRHAEPQLRMENAP